MKCARWISATARAAAGLANQAANGGALVGITRQSARHAASLRAADHARAAAMMAGAGHAAPHPALADWAWRPDLWQGGGALPAVQASGAVLAPGVKLYHDASPIARIGAARIGGHAPFAIDLSISGFDGAYLSVAIDLPALALEGLSRRHLVGLGFVVRAPVLPMVFARLTLVCGPNPLQAQVRVSLPATGGAAIAEFDLMDLGVDKRGASSGWCDLVLSHPSEGHLCLEDVVVYRRPRAFV